MRGRLLVSGVATVFFAAGVVTVGVGLQADVSPGATAFQPSVEASSPPTPGAPPSTPPRTQAAPPPVERPGQSTTEASAAASPASKGSTDLLGPVLAPSEPASVAIDSIGAGSDLMKLGLEADGTVAVPPGDAGAPAGWYENSPTPGELGSSIILGHVNSIQTGVGVFYRLHELKDADQVSVTREDGTVAVFEVYRVDTYEQASFPTAKVYGNAARAELRLITCAGFEPSTGEFTQNTVAYAYLVSSHPK
nr:class F sortase [Arthrobacter sp. H14]